MIDPHFQNHFNDFGFILRSLKGSSYFGIFFLSIFVGYVVPLPEVVLLLLIGFVAKTAGFSLPIVILVSALGGIFGDNLLYRLSFFGNSYVERFNKKMRAHKLIQYEHLVADNIGKTIFFLRFIAGVRFFGPVISGTLGIKWKEFSLYNALATTLRSAIFITLAYYSQRKMFSLIAEIEIAHNVLLFSSVFIVAGLLKFFSKKV